ncbi:hypothetical protein RJ639_038540 [Escallonia herrerae]|uniref:ABC transporter domain-containing protein n=1 Tax=Escallonia herrerae TaxID=1293975 RepID=A0AA88WNA8_9ASTE|nr:hypothetical protein RJ639_038540 [Escallonia herrerae]
MEVKRETFECSDDLNNVNETAFLLKAGRGAAFVPSGISLSSSGDSKSKIHPQKRRSFELKMSSSPQGKTIRKAKSLSAQFILNIDELINNVTAANYDEGGNTLNGGSGYGMGFLAIAGSSFPSDGNVSHAQRLQSPSRKGSNMKQSSPIAEEGWRKMHMEPTLPIRLEFEDVKYKVTVKREKHSTAEKRILHGITGSVSPGEVLALMGPSGGGKTTLLNLLSGKVKNNEGTITYNDQPYSKSLKRRIGFVLQDDVVFPHLTVKETLTYAALLRLPSTLSKEEKKERAMHVIGELGLERCQNTIIGGPLVRGVSGGERKRVCIGNEILLNPSLLFLDEPTSGLDSTTALRIVQMLHNIAQAGKTVVATIHQPSSRLFTKFDKLIILGKGSSLYSGKASDAMPYFSSIGCSPCIAMNPAEFLIDLANGNMKDKSVPSELKDKFINASQNYKHNDWGSSSSDAQEYFLGAYEARAANMKKTRFLKPTLIEENPEKLDWINSRAPGARWGEQFSILFRRGLKERRHEYLSSIRIMQVISTALIVGLLWWHSAASSPKQLQDQEGLLFFISVFWAFFPLFTAIFTFPQERAMLVKERSVGMYRLSAYLVARNTSDLPLDLILPLVFLVIVYFMVGLQPSFLAFLLTLLTIFLSIVASQGLGLAIGAAFMDVKKATTLASIVVMAFMLAGGFFIQKVPPFMSWVRYVSFNYHTYRLLLKIQYRCSGLQHGSGSCDTPSIQGQRLDSGGAEVGAMLVMIIGYRMLAYLFLRRMKLGTIT